MVPATLTTALTPHKALGTVATTPKSSTKDLACQTPSGSSGLTNYRLLYRGTLSLPDSYLHLDGLTFSARLESPTKHQLLENPLALALESMRGRQSLRFLGTVKLSEVWLDESGNVEMDIHPRAMLSKIYFENIFCLSPYPSASTSQRVVGPIFVMKSEFGVKIALGDTDGPDTTYIVVFGQVTSPAAHSVKLRVARITPQPRSGLMTCRAPRPDDPTPRRPPAALSRVNNTRAGVQKRTASSSALKVEQGVNIKKPKLALSSNEEQSKAFKVPAIPGKAKGKGKEKEDVFGSRSLSKMSNGDVAGNYSEETEIERINKNFIKKATLDHLAKTKDPILQRPIDRLHPEFKEIWASIYRGVGFALRAHMKVTPLDMHDVLPLVEAHSRMYVGAPRGGVPSNIPP